MKIWGNIPKVSGIYNNASKVDKSSRVGEVASRKDELTISGTAKDFNVAMKAVRQVPDIRQDKVDAILNKMENGNYSVPVSDVAQKIAESLNQKM